VTRTHDDSQVHVDGTPAYEIGDAIWQESLADAIRAEAYAVPALADSCLRAAAAGGAPPPAIQLMG
jgi:hypothetical protein